jgi:transcriptional regulator ATRX
VGSFKGFKLCIFFSHCFRFEEEIASDSGYDNGLDISMFSTRSCETDPSPGRHIDEREIETQENASEILSIDQAEESVDLTTAVLDVPEITSNSNPHRFYSIQTLFRKSRNQFKIPYEKLLQTTKDAHDKEQKRMERLLEKMKMLEEMFPGYRDLDSNEFLLDYDKRRHQKIVVNQEVTRHLKSHQKEAIRFLYDNCIGSVNNFAESLGSGAILAHHTGLGKTLTTLALIATISKYGQLKNRRFIILCPKSVILNWIDEAEQWGIEMKFYWFAEHSTLIEKIGVLENWRRQGICEPSVLLMGYETFRNLVLLEKSRLANNQIVQLKLDEYQERINKCLLDSTEMVVLDEGHKIKNAETGVVQALSKLKTPRRIVLSATPLQNNLNEYFSMVSFIKPQFLGSDEEFSSLFANPIKNGQYLTSTELQIDTMRERSFILYSTLEPFVCRSKTSIIDQFLPKKSDFAIFVPLTDLQLKLYKRYLVENPFEKTKGKHFFADFTALRKVWTHPRILRISLEKNIVALQRKIDELRVAGDETRKWEDKLEKLKLDAAWWQEMAEDPQFQSLSSSNKLIVLFDIIKKCQDMGEKL